MFFNLNKCNIFIKLLELWIFLVLILLFFLGIVLVWKYDGKFDVVKCFFIVFVIFFIYVVGNFVNLYYEVED